MKHTNNTQTAFLIAAMFLIALFSGETSAQKQDSGTKDSPTVSANAKIIEDKLEQFLKKSGEYTKLGDHVWTKPSQGKSIGKFDLLVFFNPDGGEVGVLVVIAEKKNIKLSQDLLYKILNFSAARVKVGITGNGDLVLGIDMSGRLMDWQEFNEATEKVVAATDKLYTKISGDLTSSTK
jgi:hypothetical protein